ncbi:hypothetical protein GCM10027589_40380 [Actinocorallia lasiicapitis]
MRTSTVEDDRPGIGMLPLLPLTVLGLDAFDGFCSQLLHQEVAASAGVTPVKQTRPAVDTPRIPTARAVIFLKAMTRS